MSESIADHGGVKNDITASAANIDAIHDASVAAADNTVYLPGSGDPENPNLWYFGDENITSGNMLMPGNDAVNRGDAGLGFIGDDPETSHLVWGEVHDDAGNIIRYDGTDVNSHDDVVYRDITYDGNIQNLTLNGGTQSGMRTFAEMNNMTIDNCRFRNFHNGVHRVVQGGDFTVNRCTYYNTGIERANEGSGGSSHPFALSSVSDLTMRDCEFQLIRGSAIDWADGAAGTGDIRRVYSEGIGINFLKVGDADSITVENWHHVGQTQELLDALDNDTNDVTNYGRFGIRRHDTANPGSIVPFTVNDVLIEKCTRGPIVSTLDPLDLTSNDGPIDCIELGTAALEQEGDQTGELDDGGNACQYDVAQLAMHDVDGIGALDLSGDSGGTIDELRYDNTGGVGNTGGVTVTTTTQGGALYGAVVPTQDEVGINTAEATHTTDFSEY